jgi:predicted alpha-1,6-mannanase (GH76 family)
LTPRKLTSTTNQMAPSVSVMATVLVWKSGERFMIAPANANAITGNELQIEIQ